MSAAGARTKRVAAKRAKESGIVIRMNMAALRIFDKRAAACGVSRASAIRTVLEYAALQPDFLRALVIAKIEAGR